MPTRNDRDWFMDALCLPEKALLPAVAARLARGEVDDAIALWAGWRVFVREAPGMLMDTRAIRFSSTLRRAVEALTCSVYIDVAWVASWRGAPDAVPDIAWDLLVGDAPLTASAIRASAMEPGMPLVVIRVQSEGKRLHLAARGPFTLDNR